MRTYLSVFEDKETAGQVAEKLKAQGVDPNQMAIANGQPAGQVEWPEEVQKWQEKGYTVLLAQTMEYLEPQVKATLAEYEPVHMQALTGLIGDEAWMDDMRYVPTPHTRDLYVKRFTEYEPVFRQIWENEFRPGKTDEEPPAGEHFNVYLPAYRYGYELAVTPRFRTQEWAAVAKQARVDWEGDHDTVWSKVEGAVKKAWEVVKDAFDDVEQGLDHDERRSRYHQHYNQTYAAIGVPYTRFDDAYRFGALLAEDVRYQDREWADIAAPVKERWTRDHPAGGAWDDVEEAIQYAWGVNLPK